MVTAAALKMAFQVSLLLFTTLRLPPAAGAALPISTVGQEAAHSAGRAIAALSGPSATQFGDGTDIDRDLSEQLRVAAAADGSSGGASWRSSTRHRSLQDVQHEVQPRQLGRRTCAQHYPDAETIAEVQQRIQPGVEARLSADGGGGERQVAVALVTVGVHFHIIRQGKFSSVLWTW